MHTRGPWRLDAFTGAVYGTDDRPIMTVGLGGEEEYRANARLIAAAPELYEAAKIIQLWRNDYGTAERLDRCIDSLVEAICKAELSNRVESGGS